MESKKNIILIGGFIETIELVISNGYNIVGIVDKSIDNIPVQYRNRLTYLGNDKTIINAILQNNIKRVPILLSPDLPQRREKLFMEYEIIRSTHVNIISSKSNISPSAQIEAKSSVVIQDFVNISSNVIVSKCVHINTYANVMHDCIIEGFVTIAPNAVLLGGVHIGKESYIGSNATILPGIKIGKNVMVGAGAVVTKNVEEGDVVIGVPARKVSKRLK